jgi:uncharacterized protein involved in outer membrane biogenesis
MPNRDRPRVVFRWRLLLLSGLAVVVLGVTALLWAAADGQLAGPVTRWLSAQLGRTLVADGGVRITLGRVTRITATGLRLANSSWGTRPDMLVARQFTVDVDTRSLLEDTVILRSLSIEGLDLLLERSAAGKNNWDFNLAKRKSSTVLPVIIERVSVPSAKIRFSGPRLDRPLDVTLGSVEQRLREDQMLELNAHGQANGAPLDLQATVGPLASLIATRGVVVRVEGTLGEIGLTMGGHIDSLAAPGDTDVTLQLRAPNAAYLASRLGIRNLGDGPVALDASISPVPGDGEIHGRVSGRIGEFELSAQGSLAKGAKFDRFTVHSQIAGPDLSLVGGLIGVNRLVVEPFKLRVDLQRAGEWLSIQRVDLELAAGRVALAGTVRPGSGLAGSHLEFSASGPAMAGLSDRLRGAEWAKGPFEATGSLRGSQHGKTEIQAKLKTNLGLLSLAGPMGVAPEYYGTQFATTVTGADFAPLGRSLNLPAPPEGTFKGEGNVEWNRAGITLRGVRLVVAGDALTLEGTLGRPRFAELADIQFTLTGDNAATLAGRFGLSGFPSEAYRVDGRIQRRKDRTEFTAVKATTSSLALQLDGALGDAPRWQATELTFVAGGSNLARFNTVVPGITLPKTAFHAAGQLTMAANMLRVRQVQVDVAGTHGTVSAEMALPLKSAAGHFEIEAAGPDPAILLPDLQFAMMVGKNFRVSAAGKWVKRQWSFERLAVAADNGTLSLTGNLDLAPRFGATAVRCEARTPSLRKLGESTNHHWPDQPLEIRGIFSATDTTATLEDLVGRLGKSDFAGRVAARNLDDKPDLDVRVDSQLLDLIPYVERPLAPAQTVASAPASERRVAKGLVIPATELSVPTLKNFTGTLAVRARELHLADQVFRDLNIQATLHQNRFALNPLEVSANDGQIKVQAELTAQGNSVLAHLSGTGKNLKIQFVPFGVGRPNATSYSADVDLRGAGATLRELAASLNGRIQFLGSGGRIASSGFMVRSNDFLKQLLSTINPIAVSQPTTEIVCTAFLLRAKDGVLTTDPALVMRTGELDVISNGSLDLKSEKLDLNFKTAARKGVGIGVAQLVNPYIKVTGTLGNPGITLDPKGALVNGGAAFATAGLSILAVTAWDRVFHSRDPCGAAAAQADREASR